MRELSGSPQMKITRRYVRTDDPLASFEGWKKSEKLQTLPSMAMFASPVASKKAISAADKSDLADGGDVHKGHAVSFA